MHNMQDLRLAWILEAALRAADARSIRSKDYQAEGQVAVSEAANSIKDARALERICEADASIVDEQIRAKVQQVRDRLPDSLENKEIVGDLERFAAVVQARARPGAQPASPA